MNCIHLLQRFASTLHLCLRLSSLLFLLQGASAVQAHSQELLIRLLDGRNGNAIRNSYVNVWLGYGRKEAVAIPTDAEGIAKLRLTSAAIAVDLNTHSASCQACALEPVLLYADDLRINVPRVLCQLDSPLYSWLSIASYSTKQLLSDGKVTANNCGKSKSVAKPGELAIYVRPLTFWEMLKE